MIERESCISDQFFKKLYNVSVFGMAWTTRTTNFKQLPVIYFNKRLMGHIAHLRKQFKAINTYDYHYVERRKKTLFTLRELNGSSFEHFEIGPVVLGKKIF